MLQYRYQISLLIPHFCTFERKLYNFEKLHNIIKVSSKKSR